MAALGTDTCAYSYMLLSNCSVDDVLVEATPLLDETLVQVVDVANLATVGVLMEHAPHVIFHGPRDLGQSYCSATEIRPKPGQNYAASTELELKFEDHSVVVDGVEGSGQVEKTERRYVTVVSSEQEIIIDLDDGSLGSVKAAIRWLHRWHQVAAIQKCF